MNRLFFVFTACLVLQFRGARAQVDELIKNLPSNKKELAISTLSVLPKQQQQGIVDYLAVIGLESYEGENIGFKNFNQALILENPCVEEVAANFYAELLVNDLDANLKFLMNPSKPGKPSLRETAKDLGLKPGWLWDKALNFAKGDKLLAMNIIGICGHDDTSQLDEDFRMKLSDFSKEKKAAYSDAEIKNKINQLWKTLQIEKKTSLEKRGGVDAILQKLKKSVGLEGGVTCPASIGAMYYAQSMGEKYDIPESLKQRIARVQAPTEGAEMLPSKYYHLMGAAYSSCFLVRRDIPNFISKKMVTGAINVYRSSSMCKSLTERENVNFKGKSVSQIFDDLLKVRDNFETCFNHVVTPGPKSADYSFWTKKLKGAPSYCYAGDLLSQVVLRDEHITNEILLKKVVRKVAEHDAVIMFKKSKFYESSNLCQGAQLGSDVRDFLEENSHPNKTGDCQIGIDIQRCVDARKLLETYLVDFEWSEAQHLAGLQFAIDHCPSLRQGKSIEAAACKALGKTETKKNRNDESRPDRAVH